MTDPIFTDRIRAIKAQKNILNLYKIYIYNF